MNNTMAVMDSNAKAQAGKGKALRHLQISHAENGGHIVEHHFESGERYHEPEMHVFAKKEGKKMIAHIAKHMGVEHESEPEAKAENAAGAAY